MSLFTQLVLISKKTNDKEYIYLIYENKCKNPKQNIRSLNSASNEKEKHHNSMKSISAR